MSMDKKSVINLKNIRLYDQRYIMSQLYLKKYDLKNVKKFFDERLKKKSDF